MKPASSVLLASQSGITGNVTSIMVRTCSVCCCEVHVTMLVKHQRTHVRTAIARR